MYVVVLSTTNILSLVALLYYAKSYRPQQRLASQVASRRPNNIRVYIRNQEMFPTAMFQEGKVDTERLGDLVQAFLKIWAWFL